MAEQEPTFNFSQEDITQSNQFNSAVDEFKAANTELSVDELQQAAEQAAKSAVSNTVYEETYVANGGSAMYGGEEVPIEQDFKADEVAYAAKIVAEGRIDNGVPAQVNGMLDEALADNKAFDENKAS